MRSARIVVYRDKSDENRYRWRFLCNGRILADSGQSYTNRVDAIRGREQTLGGTVWLPEPQTAPSVRVIR